MKGVSQPAGSTGAGQLSPFIAQLCSCFLGKGTDGLIHPLDGFCRGSLLRCENRGAALGAIEGIGDIAGNMEPALLQDRCQLPDIDAFDGFQVAACDAGPASIGPKEAGTERSQHVVPYITWRGPLDVLAVVFYLSGIVPLLGIALMELGLLGRGKEPRQRMFCHFRLLIGFLVVSHLAMIFGMTDPGLMGAHRGHGPEVLRSIPLRDFLHASLGEISDAVEKVSGRFQAVIHTISGVYSSEFTDKSELNKARQMADEFEELTGRRPRIFVAKMGQDGHDRGQKVIASSFADMGWDVDVGPLFQTPQETAQDAVDNDVHMV